MDGPHVPGWGYLQLAYQGEEPEDVPQVQEQAGL